MLWTFHATLQRCLAIVDFDFQQTGGNDSNSSGCDFSPLACVNSRGKHWQQREAGGSSTWTMAATAAAAAGFSST
jgi:hypothetical protein